MKQALMWLLLVLSWTLLPAQILLSDYVFAYELSSYEEITGGILLGSISNDEHRFLDPDDLNGDTEARTGRGFDIGFELAFAGAWFDRIGINTNGWICLGQSSLDPFAVVMTSSDYKTTPLNTTATTHLTVNPQLVSRIAACGRDLEGKTGASLRVQTVGTEPNRVCVIQWNNYKRKGSLDDNLNFQIRLYETSNQIVLSHGEVSTVGLFTMQAGLRTAPVSPVSNFALRTTSGDYGHDWAQSLPGADATATMVMSSPTSPLPGAKLSWSPPAASPIPLTPQNLSISIAGADVFLNWEEVTHSTTGTTLDDVCYEVYCSIEPEGEYQFLGSSIHPYFMHFGAGLDCHRMFYTVYALTAGREQSPQPKQ